MLKRWRIDRRWEGRPAFILGGGPSLAEADVDALHGRGAVVAVNNAFRLAPWADLLYVADARWFDDDWGNWREAATFAGPVATRAPTLGCRAILAEREILQLDWNREAPLSRDPGSVAGYCGGGNALNLAWLAGADPIVLVGFDMSGGNWHGGHRIAPRQEHYQTRFIPALSRMAGSLEGVGATVINATPCSRLTAFPVMPFQAALCEVDRCLSTSGR